MNIQINHHSENPYSEASSGIVHSFLQKNSHSVQPRLEIDLIIKQLATEILKEHQLSPESTSVNLSISAFPHQMQEWAFALQAIGIQTKMPSISSDASNESTSIKKGEKTERIDLSKQDWSDFNVVTRSSQGVRGAWFYTHPEIGSIVVKNQDDLEDQLMGNLFLRGMGLNAPDCKLVQAASEEGAQLALLGNDRGLNEKNSSQYLLMKCVEGSSYENLNLCKSAIALITLNLEALGELAVYDLVLGNFDRFQLEDMSFNAGNIMFEENILCPIDTDCLPLAKDSENRIILVN